MKKGSHRSTEFLKIASIVTCYHFQREVICRTDKGGDHVEKQIIRHAPKLRLEKRKRVAAYARVSSGKDAMLHSLAEQVSRYSSFIKQHPAWVFAGVYADQALTGTKEERPEFQRLLADCRAGKVDMILTKSSSRFARNTVTTLQTVRELKTLGIDVYFEEENIHSMSAEGEMMLTVRSAFAQEESRSASENMKWRIRKGFERGELMCWRILFGYKISKEKGIEIDPVEGPVAREVFRRIADGESINSVAKWLNSTGHYGALGGKWNSVNLKRVLSNEKYTGDAWLQKTYVNNHIEKKKLPNEGEVPRYYATETHPALIDPDTFRRVQERLAVIAEKNAGRPKRRTNEFTGLIRCPYCGCNYRRTLKNGTPGWICTTYYNEGKDFCRSKKIPEDTLRTVISASIGFDEWNPEVFREQVRQIEVSGPNTIELHMMDGSIRNLEWKDRSRRESWTPEMKEKASQTTWRRYHG